MQSRFIMAGNIRTHYLEAGEGENHLILLHGGEYGGCAETSYEFNIDALARNFHVYALDMVGYGLTDKLFNFENIRSLRIRHIRDFLETLCIDSASFIGNSTGGGLILEVASMKNPVWNINKIICISGGGPNNPEAHQILSDYDCTIEYMKKIHDLMFYDSQWKTDEYVEKRHRMSILPGSWECLSAARFRSPIVEVNKSTKPLQYSPSYKNIEVPVLIVGGDHDTLKFPDFATRLAELIPDCKTEIFKQCGHCAQIEYSDEFNRMATEFLLDNR